MKTKTEQYNNLQELLNSFSTNEIIDVSHDKYEFLKELIKKHPKQEKFKGDLDHFVVRTCGINPRNKNITYVATDGYEETFSIYKCLDQKAESNLQYFKRAMRYYIYPQIRSFRDDYFQKNSNKGYVTCEISNLKFKIDNCHVDHRYPKTFDSMVNTFIKEYDIDVDKQTYLFPRHNQVEITNNEIISKFLNFHQNYADLRCVYFRANLQQKQNSKPFEICK